MRGYRTKKISLPGGRVIEIVGQYNAQTDPSTIKVDEDRARRRLERGAQPTDTVRKLLKTQGIR